MKGNGPETIEEWWDACHTGIHPETDFFLTGHQGPDVWNYLQIKHLIKSDINVLNIGVGKGHCTRNLAALGCRVSALDISSAALNKVKDITAGTYLANALNKIPENHFDIAISFLVVQHMDNISLSSQLSAIFKALKPGGLFAFQYSFPLEPNLPTSPGNTELCKIGGVTRSSLEMGTLCKNAGFINKKDWIHSEYPQFGSGWRIIHLKKPNK
ncbi:hypothetical protein MTBBW1_2560008 [Desulfamplus magnetovallimortis]|uniref:Methyltransferase type 11 domain-containing protein n=1 Tax=Desulfamplus magnetovallimortis TaxID=1246637 RepID=A0A1W1HEP8_9BACT|nr:class I SAM-dependent methyltransferase [Desulfamplus magnetovallimortis]SLM30967.1 hypothetical protein MTBBW1_2560008 [Desulfamplus magnetovallimortis]